MKPTAKTQGETRDSVRSKTYAGPKCKSQKVLRRRERGSRHVPPIRACERKWKANATRSRTTEAWRRKLRPARRTRKDAAITIEVLIPRAAPIALRELPAARKIG